MCYMDGSMAHSLFVLQTEPFMYLDQIKATIAKLPALKVSNFIGCSEEEITRLEKCFGLSLPMAYKEFLLWMGKDAGPILRGSNCFYSDLFQLNHWANRLLDENGLPDRVPENAFVFFMHQGYQFAFMYPSESEDPAIYYFNEMSYEPDLLFTISYPSFTAFLDDEIENTAAFLEKM